MYLQAAAIVQRHQLNAQGITYAAQGFALDMIGTLPAAIIDDHLLVSSLIYEYTPKPKK